MRAMICSIVIVLVLAPAVESLKLLDVNLKRGLISLGSSILGLNMNLVTALALDESMVMAPAPTMATTTVSNTYPALSSSERQLIELFDQASPSVVYINTFSKEIDMVNMNVLSSQIGEGSGFIWDLDGHVVTNYHVIKDAVSADVIITSPAFKTNQVFKAQVTGVDPDKDIAVLKIDVPPAFRSILRPLKLGTSSNIRVGQTTIAIGNPFGLDHSLTTGVVSGLGREVKSVTGRPIGNVIQTDASINPGNSGGPLLDSSGNLIGMNTAIYTMSGSSSGVGFAIPVDTVKYEVTSIIRDGRIIRPSIGFSYLESSRARMLGIRNGVLVLNVPNNSPASAAGLRGTTRSYSGYDLGDIVVGINDDKVASETDIFRILEKYKVGDSVILKIIRLSDKPKDDGEYPVRQLTLKLIDQVYRQQNL